MIDFTNIFQLVSFISVAALALIYLLGTIIVLARKGKGASKIGVVFYVLAWVLFLPSLALALIGVIARFKPFGIAVSFSDNGSFSLLFNENKLFGLPFVGKFMQLISKYLMIEIAVYALFALLLISVIAWVAKWKKVKKAKMDGDGYLSVEEVAAEEVAYEQSHRLESEAEFEVLDEQPVEVSADNEEEIDEQFTYEPTDFYDGSFDEETTSDELMSEEEIVEEELTYEEKIASEIKEIVSEIEELEGEIERAEELAFEESDEPVVEDAPIVEETPAVEETPIVEETPAVEEPVANEEKEVDLSYIIDDIKDIASAEITTDAAEEKVLDFGSIVYSPRAVYKPERKRKAKATVVSSLANEPIKEEPVAPKEEPIAKEESEPIATAPIVEEAPVVEEKVEEKAQTVPVIAVKMGDTVQYIPIQYVAPEMVTKVETTPAPIDEEPVEPEKKRRRVSTRAGQLFNQYIQGKNEEEKKKLQSSIDTVRLDKKD